MFETPGKIIIGLERLILETIGFDFRTRYPQKLLVKIIRAVTASLSPPDAQTVFATAYAATSDMYKTLVPIRRTSLTMALAATELALSLTGHLPACRAALDDFTHRKNRFHSRPAVRAAMSDLLDLYIQHHKATRLGARFDLSTFMDIKIQLNAEQQDAQERGEQKLVDPADIQPCQRCAAAAAGPRGSSSAMRFVFDPEAAEAERDTVNGYFNQEFEEYEVEVEEPIPPPPQHNNHNNNHNGNNQQNRGPRRWDDRDGPPPPPGRGRGRRWRERGGHEHRWGGPYGGGNGGGHRGDRRGRGRYR